jgi:large subunit ribosomal protein L14
MVQQGTILKVCDRTGVILAQCIKVFGPSSKRIAKLGDVVLVSVKKVNVKRFQLTGTKKRKRFLKGSLYRALVVRTKVNYCLFTGLYIKFDENTVVLVNKKVVPISNRVFGPILKKLCMK